MKQKLELTWVGKDVRPRLEPRVLLENADLSYTAKARVSDADVFDNRLVFGDNLLALKALEQELTGKVKCIFIDPPYNTGSAFEHYDDGLEHSLWLSMMRDRLELLRTMLSDDGSIWITIDDSEAHYLKVICDEIFGRRNFVANVVWQKKSSSQANTVWLSDSHDHILVYAKDKDFWKAKRLNRTEEQNAIYKYSDEFDGIAADGNWYGRGPWFPGDFTLSLASGARGKQFAKTGKSDNLYEIITPSGRSVMPAKGRAWAYIQSSFEQLKAENRVYFGSDGTNKPTIKRFLSEIQDSGIVAMTSWHYDEVGENRIAMQEQKSIFPDNPFATPKPERLLERILHIATNPGDLVLDSFAGSGTTGAVAHKMGRRWVMIELQETAHTHIIPRLQKVIDGTDQGGISASVGWKGGGGFRYYHLAPTLIVNDRFGQQIINPEFKPEMLAEALCKLEGFTYQPANTQEEYWMHGYSTERDFIFVTTQHMTGTQLQVLSDDVGDERTLLIMCTAFDANLEMLPNLTVKKIPQWVLEKHKLEWGHDDYSLKIENLPSVAANFESQDSGVTNKKRARKEVIPTGVPSLFDQSGDA